MNVPNSLTLLRVVFALTVFSCIAIHQYDFGLLLFVLAALTDFLDGWWARRFKQITVFGRIMDPFADKFLICGVFISLATIPALSNDPVGGFPAWLMLQPWMVIVIVGRELLITSLRAVVESAGGDFSAKWIGKWKMLFQCAAVVTCFLYLSGGAQRTVETPLGAKLICELDAPEKMPLVNPLAAWVDGVLMMKSWRNGVFYCMVASLWATVAITLYSGIEYCVNAARMLRRSTG